MTQEEKELLLKDLCARVYHGIKVKVAHLQDDVVFTLYGISKDAIIVIKDNGSKFYIPITIDVLPYLRLMSSMTEEEEKEYRNIDNRSYSCPIDYAHIPASERIDWLNKHHFDYRGLIPIGLALKAPNGMYRKEKQQ